MPRLRRFSRSRRERLGSSVSRACPVFELKVDPEVATSTQETDGVSSPCFGAVFDHTIRRPAKVEGEEDTPQNRHPVPSVHIDQSTSSVRCLSC